jgi:hypothetical protein
MILYCKGMKIQHVRGTSLFLASLSLSYFIWSFIWSVLIQDKLYHCIDPIIFFVDFIPPFIHENTQNDYYVDGVTGERLILIWFSFIFAIFLTTSCIFLTFKNYFSRSDV